LATASPDTSNALITGQIAGLRAGENIDAGAPCRVGADGLVYMSNGTAIGTNSRVHGFAYQSARLGQACTLGLAGVRVGQYATGMAVGSPLFLAATAGRLDTAATTGGTAAIALAVTSTDIVYLALAL
jgi:hypothetical protein